MLIEFFQQKPKRLYLLFFILTIPALFYNLGLLPLTADEPTRANVALEFILSDNFIVPTINGEFYYKKPPFYNWILSSLFLITDNFSEWIIRLPSVIPLLFYGLSIFYFFKKYVNQNIAFLAAALMIVNGRMLIYSSFLGHIDVFYSWITFLSFIVIYEQEQKKNWIKLFVFSYFLAAIAFMCKALPTVVFQGISLVVYLFFKKEFKRLFSWQHLTGLAVFFVLVGGYFLAYHQFNSLENFFTTIWTESSQRTVLEKAWYTSIVHFFTFPFETFAHIFPWTILVIFCWKKSFINHIKNNSFLNFSTIILLANSIPYWLSPETLPRYLFMLYPFLFLLLSYGYFSFKDEMPKRNAFWYGFMLIFSIGLMLACFVPPFIDLLKNLPFLYIKIAILVLPFGFLIYLFLRIKNHRTVIFACVLLLGRLAFDFFVLEYRFQEGNLTKYKNQALEISQLTKNEPLTLFNSTPLSHDMTFYIEESRKEILKINSKLIPNEYKIVSKDFLKNKKPHVVYESIYTFQVRWKNTELELVKIIKN